MRAPATKHSLALALLLVAACASNPDPGVAATPSGAVAQEAQSLDRYAPPPPVSVSPVEELADLEHSLAAYEAELAQHEARLQSMGVRIARAEPAGPRADADDKADANRFARPPPARPGDAASSPTAGAAGGTARPPAPATPPRPTSKPSPEQSPSKDRKQAKKESEGDATATKAPRANDPSARTASELGKSADSPARDEAREKDGERSRCADLCDVAHATCDLEAKICDLATRHTDEPRYAEVCQRAGDDCRAAADACTLCSP